MTISERAVGSVIVLDVAGDLKLGDGVEQLREQVRSLLQRGHTRLLLNLAAVPYADSAALGELVRAYAATSRLGGTLKLLNATKRLRDLLVITKLATVFELLDDEAAAIASFGP